MKKLVLVAAAALTCSGLVSAQSSTVSVYGRVDNGVRTWSGNAGGQSADLYHSALGGSRWGLNGSHDLGGGMKAGAVLEGQILSDVGGTAGGSPTAKTFDRQSFVYLSEEKWGTVKLGRDNTFGLDALFSGALDVAGLLDAAESNATRFNAGTATQVDAYGPNPLTTLYSTARGTRRLDNVVKYTNTAGDFNYGLGYAFGETDGNLKANRTQNASLGYKKDKLTAVTTYQTTNDPTNKKMDIWNIGGRYNFGQVSAVAAYHVLTADAGYNPLGGPGGTTTRENYFDSVLTGTANKGKVNVANVGFAYNFKPQWTYTLSYYNVDQKEGVKVGKVDSYITHLQYDLNKYVSLYGIVDYQKAKEGLKTTAAGASGDQLAFTAGVRVMFDASKSF